MLRVAVCAGPGQGQGQVGESRGGIRSGDQIPDQNVSCLSALRHTQVQLIVPDQGRVTPAGCKGLQPREVRLQVCNLADAKPGQLFPLKKTHTE